MTYGRMLHVIAPLAAISILFSVLWSDGLDKVCYGGPFWSLVPEEPAAGLKSANEVYNHRVIEKQAS
eukprot:6209120-Pleurochrysis_carterae.AAC.2